MGDVTTRRRLDGLVESCYAGRDATQLRVDALRRLRTLVSIDAAFFATVDPLTLLFTSAVSEEPLIEAAALFMDNEYGPADVNRFADLAASDDPVGSLDRATRGERRTSRRYTEIMAPLNLGDELRVVLRAGGRAWGVMCLHREDGAAGFSDSEVALLRNLAPHLAEGLRRAHLLDGAGASESLSSTGIIVLDRDLRLVSINPAAENWLGQIAEDDWPASAELPLVVYATASALNRQTASGERPHPVPAVTLRTAAGQWVVIHASHLEAAHERQTAVVLQPASPTQLASVFFATRGLTPAQERVASLVVQGNSTQQIVRELHISQHTVQEHLKAVFDKFDVHSRRDLVATLLTRH